VRQFRSGRANEWPLASGNFAIGNFAARTFRGAGERDCGGAVQRRGERDCGGAAWVTWAVAYLRLRRSGVRWTRATQLLRNRPSVDRATVFKVYRGLGLEMPTFAPQTQTPRKKHNVTRQEAFVRAAAWRASVKCVQD
jgi:hypothetical protein